MIKRRTQTEILASYYQRLMEEGRHITVKSKYSMSKSIARKRKYEQMKNEKGEDDEE